MRQLSIDLETYSSVDIKKAGMYKYVQSPDFEILLLAYSLDNSPVKVLDFTQSTDIPAALWAALWDPSCIKHAYNAPFEWRCLSRWAKVEQPETWLPQWRDTMLHALYCGYTGSLDATGRALGLPEDKQKLAAGKALIKYFCQPCAPTKTNGGRTRNLPRHDPEKWKLFTAYNRQDVVTEMEIAHRLSAFPVPDEIQAQWVQDQIINARGVAVDHDLIEGALACSAEVNAIRLEEARQLTGLDNPNSAKQLLPWLQEHGAPLDNLQKATVADALAGEEIPDEARRALELRQELSKTSVQKYNSLSDIVCTDGRVRGVLQFYGANRTGRWAGRLVQVQNLPRTYISMKLLPMARDLVKHHNTAALQAIFGNVSDTLSQLIRTAFVPETGRLFVDADFSAIEARVIAWLSGEQWRLHVFSTHGKIYEASASAMFGVPLETIAKGRENYHLRAKGKVAELALGYQGGPSALMRMDSAHTLNEEELPEIVRRWRQSSPCIVQLWKDALNCAVQAVQEGKPGNAGHCIFRYEGDVATGQLFLTITLPSGRKLFYAEPTVGADEYGRPVIHFWGVNQTTKKWEQQETYGGRLVENITQAVARDCLAVNISRLEQAGFPIVFHVHDEVVIEIDESRADLDAVVKIMSQPVPWAPGLPLAADGWTGAFFTKD